MSDCYRETHRTSRKAHRCCVSEGEGWGYKLCAFCCALMHQTRALEDEPDWHTRRADAEEMLREAVPESRRPTSAGGKDRRHAMTISVDTGNTGVMVWV